MRTLLLPILAVSLFAGCAGVEPGAPDERVDSQKAALTQADVDVAPECQGILDFLNTASYATLDVYLPSNVASNLDAQRAIAPFASIADVSAVPLVGPSRLEQIEGGARAEGYIDASCVGIMDEIAVSADDEARMLDLVNNVSSTELHDILPYAWNGAVTLLGARPYASADAVADAWGIGDVSTRNIRNAATLSVPLEDLIDAVNALPNGDRGTIMARHFDRYDLVWEKSGAYQLSGLTCFGIDPNSLPSFTTIRANLADENEVRADVTHAVNYANYSGQLPASVVADGLANLDERIAGRSFKGCYISYANDPWSGNNLAFFVDTETGFSVMTETSWSE